MKLTRVALQGTNLEVVCSSPTRVILILTNYLDRKYRIGDTLKVSTVFIIAEIIVKERMF